MKKLLLFLLIISLLVLVTGCFENQEEVTIKEIETPIAEEPKEEEEKIEIETNALKIDSEEATNQVILALTKLLTTDAETPASEVRVDNVKIYSSEEEQNPTIQMLNLGPNDVVFEVQYAVKPTEGTNPNLYTAGTGVVNGDWVEEKYNVGVLRSDENGNYTISDFGTGF